VKKKESIWLSSRVGNRVAGAMGLWFALWMVVHWTASDATNRAGLPNPEMDASLLPATLIWLACLAVGLFVRWFAQSGNKQDKEDQP
jgi:hypothetical protein